MRDKIRIGIMGCADIAKRLVIPNMIQTGKYQIIAIGSRTAEKANEFARMFSCEPVIGYENLLERDDIDSIYIPLPTGLHFEWIIKSLKAKKNVFAEKSIANNIDETNQIIDLAIENKCCIFENFMFVFHSQYDFVKQRIQSGEIGDIRLLRSSFGFPLFNVENNIRYKKELGGGALLDAGAYTIMASHFFLGRNQKVIAASLENLGWEVDMQGSALLKSGSGIVSQLAFGFDNFYQNHIEIWGSKGKIIVEKAFTAGPGFMPKVIIENQSTKTEFLLTADNHFQKILEKFYTCIRNDQSDYMIEQIRTQSRLLSDLRLAANLNK